MVRFSRAHTHARNVEHGKAYVLPALARGLEAADWPSLATVTPPIVCSRADADIDMPTSDNTPNPSVGIVLRYMKCPPSWFWPTRVTACERECSRHRQCKVAYTYTHCGYKKKQIDSRPAGQKTGRNIMTVARTRLAGAVSIGIASLVQISPSFAQSLARNVDVISSLDATQAAPANGAAPAALRRRATSRRLLRWLIFSNRTACRNRARRVDQAGSDWCGRFGFR